MLLEQHKLNLYVFAKMDYVLRELHNQILDVTASYYIKLQRIMDTLINTFSENKYDLENKNILDTNGSFGIPMMTVVELKKYFDTEMESINVPAMLNSFMTLFVQNKEEWIQEDETKITRLVTDFFVNTAFNGFARKTITSFLEDKYKNKYGGKIFDGQLAESIYNDLTKVLIKKATPLFCFNNHISSRWRYENSSFVSFPSDSAAIRQAVRKLEGATYFGFEVESALTDRIFMLQSVWGLPLSSYYKCTDYEQVFFKFKESGLHSYEGKPLKGLDFTDWNKLPSITPQSIVDMDHAPVDLMLRIKESNNLYERALNIGVLDDEGNLYKADEAHVIRFLNACEDCEIVINRVLGKHDECMLRQKVETLKKLLNVPMIRIKKVLPSDGDRWTKEVVLSIQKDYFFASPALHDSVRESVELVEKIIKRADSIIKIAEEKMQLKD